MVICFLPVSNYSARAPFSKLGLVEEEGSQGLFIASPVLRDASWKSVSPRTRYLHGQGRPCHHPNAGYLSSPVGSRVHSWRRKGSLSTYTLGMKNVRATLADNACSAHERVHENGHCALPFGGLWEHHTRRALAISESGACQDYCRGNFNSSSCFRAQWSAQDI